MRVDADAEALHGAVRHDVVANSVFDLLPTVAGTQCDLLRDRFKSIGWDVRSEVRFTV